MAEKRTHVVGIPKKIGKPRSTLTKRVVGGQMVFFDQKGRVKRIHNIGEARHNLPQIVEMVGSGSTQKVYVGKRGELSAAVVSSQSMEPILEPNSKERRLAFLVTLELLGDAPPHIRTPAVDELSQLPLADLFRLYKIPALPLDDTAADRLKHGMRHPEAYDRLVRRRRLADALADARDAGLYDMLEDAASRTIDDANASAE